MRQVWITRVGGPEVLQLKEAPDPQAQAGQVRIRVKAAGINFADLLARQGLYPDAPKLPAVVGYEVAGVVDQAGEGAGWQVGDRVGAFTQFGGYSDIVVVPSTFAFPILPGLSFEEAAAIPVNYLTAWLMLVHQGNLRKGDKVLIHAAAGGVGQAALQISCWKGAEVFGTAGASKHARLGELGVDHCIDYHHQDFEAEVQKITKGRGVDLVLDAVGGDSYRKSYRCLAPLGKLMMFGISSFSPGKSRKIFSVLKGLWRMPAFKPIALMNKNRGVLGFNLGHLWDRQELLSRCTAEILNLVGEGALRPRVDRSFPLEQAAEAHAYIHARKNFGKVVLLP